MYPGCHVPSEQDAIKKEEEEGMKKEKKKRNILIMRTIAKGVMCCLETQFL